MLSLLFRGGNRDPSSAELVKRASRVAFPRGRLLALGVESLSAEQHQDRSRDDQRRTCGDGPRQGFG
jgi:hypothetical protein